MHATSSIGAAAVLALAAGSGLASGGAAAADCPAGTGGIAVACPSAAQQAGQQHLRQRLDRTLATDPTQRRSQRLRSGGRDPEAQGAAPFALVPAPNHATYATGLEHWGSFLAKSDAQRIEDAKALAPEGLPVPKPSAAQGHSLDVWARGRFDAGDSAPADRHAHTSYIGADYMLGRSVVFGGMVQLDDAEGAFAGTPGATAGQGYMAGPYMAMRLAPNLLLDARMAWGRADDTLALDGGDDSFDTQRRMTGARLQGDWTWQDWRFSPGADVTVIEERAGALGHAGAEASQRNITLGPQIARPFAAGDGRTVEPFVHLRSTVGLDAAGAPIGDGAAFDGADIANTLGGGVTVSKPDAYTLRATTDLEGVGSEAQAVRGRVQVTVPLDRFR